MQHEYPLHGCIAEANGYAWFLQLAHALTDAHARLTRRGACRAEGPTRRGHGRARRSVDIIACRYPTDPGASQPRMCRLQPRMPNLQSSDQHMKCRTCDHMDSGGYIYMLAKYFVQSLCTVDLAFPMPRQFRSLSARRPEASAELSRVRELTAGNTS